MPVNLQERDEQTPMRIHQVKGRHVNSYIIEETHGLNAESSHTPLLSERCRGFWISASVNFLFTN